MLRRRSVVMPKQPTKPRAAMNRPGLRRRITPRPRHMSQHHVRPLAVIVLDALVNEVVQVFLAEHHKVIKTLVFQGLRAAFRMGVQIRLRGPDAMDLGALGLENRVELTGELRVPVMNHVADRQAVFLGIEDEVACLLGDPGAVGMRSRGVSNNLPALEMDEEQDEAVDQAAERPDLFADEVTSPERVGVDLEELVPRAFSALWSRIKASFLEDVADCGLADVADAELPQFTEDAGVAPAGLTGEAKHQVADLLGRPWPTGLALAGSSRPGLLNLRHPTLEGSVRDNRDEFSQRRTNLAAEPVLQA